MSRLSAPFGDGEQFVFVKALQRDGIDLDPQPGLLRGINAVQHLRQAAPAGDVGEFLFVQRIKRDIHAAHASGIKIVGETLQAGCHWWSASVLSARRCPDGGSCERKNVMMSRRTSGSPPVMRSFSTPRPDEGRAHPVQFLQRQQFLLGQEGHVFGHAIDTAEIAAVSDRNAQIGDGAGKGVNERRCCHDVQD